MTGARRPRLRALQKTHRIGRPQCLENPKPPRGRKPTKPSALLSKLNRNASITAASLSGTDAPPNRWQMPLRNSPALPTDSATEPHFHAGENECADGVDFA